MIATPATVGYLDRMSYRPGQGVTLYASNQSSQLVDVRLVRLARGPVPGRDLPAAVAEIAWEGAGRYEVASQASCVGSFFSATLANSISSRLGTTVGAWIWPTMVAGPNAQTVTEIATEGHSLVIELLGGRVRAVLITGTEETLLAEVDNAVRDRAWSFVSLHLVDDRVELTVTAGDRLYSADGKAAVHDIPTIAFDAGSHLTFAARGARDVTLCEGYARGRADDHFEGKIAYPFVLFGRADVTKGPASRESLTAAVHASGGALWDMAPQHTGSARYRTPVLAGSAEPGILVNLPNQGVTGPDWNATAVSFRDKPEQYSAAHFHSTDIVDVGWEPVIRAPLPAILASAVYGVELRSQDGSTDTIPLFVNPAPDVPRKRVAFLASTFTYLAYGNEDLISFFANAASNAIAAPDIEATLRARQVTLKREWGLSAYDTHADGSGIHYSSSLRPLLDVRPDYTFWAYEEGARGFTADLYLVEWLEKNGYEFDVLTDLELHLGGVSALDGYDVVLTGSHPEYHSANLLDGLEAFRDRGGKIGYLGGNGFYWVTGLINTSAQVIEIRRGHVGIRTWASEPGEVDLVSTWEPGGLWRFRGRAPQRLVGVGMSGQGGESRPYWLPTDAADRELAPWFYEGLDGETIGEKGFVNGAAAGDEFDRADSTLGTPPGTIILAASKDHPNEAQRAAEELLQLFHGSSSGPNDPDIRADMVYFDTPGGGAVFSSSAIAFIASLLINDGNNTSSRALRNVMEHFLE